MTATFHLDIVSPERAIFAAEATLVEVPGSEGDFGVMPGHAPLISTIRPGVVKVHAETGDKRFFLLSGYAEVTGENCVILSEHVRDLATVARTTAEDELAQARRVLEHAANDGEKKHALEGIEAAEALLATF